MLFGYLIKSGRRGEGDFWRPKVITYSSDGLGANMRRVIEEEFGIPVLTAYQASEALKIGFDCRHHLGITPEVPESLSGTGCGRGRGRLAGWGRWGTW